MASTDHGNGNGANRIVWGAAAAFALGYLGLLGWTASKVVDMSERLAKVEIMLRIEQQP